MIAFDLDSTILSTLLMVQFHRQGKENGTSGYEKNKKGIAGKGNYVHLVESMCRSALPPAMKTRNRVYNQHSANPPTRREKRTRQQTDRARLTSLERSARELEARRIHPNRPMGGRRRAMDKGLVDGGN
jgi:hypothetical protein